MMPSEMAAEAGVGKKNLEPRYYFLKLPKEFFQDKIMRKLRRLPGGELYTIIALKILLLGATSDSRIYYDGIEKTFAEEIALSIDEDAMATNVVIEFLISCGWLVQESKNVLFAEKSKELTESISARTERWRRQKEKEAMAKIAAPLPEDCRKIATDCHNVAIEEDADAEVERDKEIEKMQEGKELPELCPSAFIDGNPRVNPSLSEIQDFASIVGFYAVSPEDFFNRFSSSGWMDGEREITDWKALYTTLEGLARKGLAD